MNAKHSFRCFAVCLLLLAASTGSLFAQSWTTGTFSYDAAGNITATGDNVYFYDTAGRLVHGTAEGTANVQEYSYDGFGNRLTAATTGLNCAGNVACGGTVSVNANNRITTTGVTYDTAGNMKAMAGSSYGYDGAGMMSSLVAPNAWRYDYIYTADDERIATYTGGGNWQFTIRGLDGKVLREMTAYQPGQGSATWSWTRDHVWRDGQLLATVSSSGTEQFHLDHLGTPRVVTDASGKKVGYHAYYPFGEELNLGSDEYPPDRLKFTGHERDTVLTSSLDYMHARYYNGNLGRFLAVDAHSGGPSFPQSWNRYAYAHNNPIALVDRNGQWPTQVLHTHQNAIDVVLSSVVPASDRRVLKDAQVTADMDQQHQYKHAMRVPGQSAHDAAIAANAFIDAQMTEAISDEKAGKHSMALTHLGLAMHTLQDATSPAHTGFQVFDPSNSSTSPETVKHVMTEFYDPSSRPYLYDDGGDLDRATYDAYKYFAQSTGLPTPPVPTCADDDACFTAADTPNIHLDVPPQ